jgi:hypothetical protein
MIILKDCLTHVSNGVALRTVLTFISFYLIKTYANKNHIHVILPFALTILDGVDNFFIKYDVISKGKSITAGTNCTKKSKESKFYQVNDKIIDTLSYILCYIYFYEELNDTLLEIFIAYRTIGVILFIVTHNKYFLVSCFDFVKEYMLYKHFFQSDYTYLAFFIILKIIFEYVFHMIYN